MFAITAYFITIRPFLYLVSTFLQKKWVSDFATFQCFILYSMETHCLVRMIIDSFTPAFIFVITVRYFIKPLAKKSVETIIATAGHIPYRRAISLWRPVHAGEVWWIFPGERQTATELLQLFLFRANASPLLAKPLSTATYYWWLCRSSNLLWTVRLII